MKVELFNRYAFIFFVFILVLFPQISGLTHTNINSLNGLPSKISAYNSSLKLADLGSSYAIEQNWQKALEAYDEALGLYSYNNQALMGRAEVYARLGNKPHAVMDWQRAKDAYFVLLSKAHQARRAGNLETSIEAYTWATWVRPNDFSSYYHLAEAYSIYGSINVEERIKKSAEAYRKAASYAPSLYQRARSLAWASYIEGDWQSAYEMWGEAALQDSENPEPLVRQASIAYYRLTGDIEQARTLVIKALEIAPNYMRAYEDLGMMYREGEEQYDEAAYWFDAGLNVADDEASAYLLYQAGINEVKRNAYVKGKGLLERALTIEPNNALIYYWLGQANEKLGQPDIALTYYRQSVELNPQQLDFRLALADLYYDLGQFSQARIEYETLLDLNPDLVGIQERIRILNGN